MRVGWDGIKVGISYSVGKIQTCGNNGIFQNSKSKLCHSFIWASVDGETVGNRVRLYFWGAPTSLYKPLNQFFCLVSRSCLTVFVTPWIAAHQAPLFKEFPRQEF